MGQGRPGRTTLRFRWRWPAQLTVLLAALAVLGLGVHRLARSPATIGLATPASLSNADRQFLRAGLTATFGVPVRSRPEAMPTPVGADPLDGRDALVTIEGWPRVTHQRVLAVVDAEGDTAERTFVFGLARRAGRAAVVFTPRLRAGANPDRFRQRLLRVAIHELAHAYGLGHCANPHCVMAYSADLPALDQTTDAFCPRCTRLLAGWSQVH